MAHIYRENYPKRYDDKVTKQIYDFLNHGKKPIALKCVRDYLKEYPQDGVGYLLYVKCMAESDDDEAKKICFQLIDGEIKVDSKTISEALFLLGTIEKRHGNENAALEYYQKSAELGYLLAKHELARRLISKGDYEKALDIVSDIEFSPYDVHTPLIKASIQCYLEMYDEALETINQIEVSSLTKENEIYYYTKTKALAYMNLDRIKEAEKLLEDYTNGISLYNRNHCLLIRCYLRRGKVKKAYSLSKDIMKNAEDDIRQYNRFYLGDIYQKLGNFDQAKKEYIMVTNSNNNSKISSAYISLGELALIEKDYEQARRYFQKVDSVNKRYKEKSALFLVIVEMKLQNNSKAYKMLEEIDVCQLSIELQNLYRQTKSILMYQRGKSIEIDSYFTKQLVQYNKSVAIKHIGKKHQKNGIISFFDSSISISSLINRVPSLLEDGIMIENRTTEKYLVPYKNVGYCNGKLVHYMEVVMLPNSNHVLTMYPVNHISEEELQKEMKGVFQKKKTLSQIDKFNARYGLKG